MTEAEEAAADKLAMAYNKNEEPFKFNGNTLNVSQEDEGA